MRLYSEIIGKQILNLGDGRRIGTVRDCYLDSGAYTVAAVFLGHDDLFGGRAGMIRRERIAVFGRDAVLVMDDEVEVLAGANVPAIPPEDNHWVPGNQLVGRELQTVHEQPLGIVADLVLSEPELTLTGFVLRIEGLVAEAALDPPRAHVLLRNIHEQQPGPALFHIQRPFPLVILGTE
jgi:sporulation protein YlmC with PRC-barrel domain